MTTTESPMLPLPRLEDYDVSPVSGFLPQDTPLIKLPDAYYAPWENIVNNLPSLILSRKIRHMVDNKLPILSIDKLSSTPELRRAYSILGFIAHAYIWGVDIPSNKLPRQISEPLVQIADLLQLPPLATYAGLVLWNFKKIIPDDELELDNITSINTFTGSIDETWFYLVSVFFEQIGAKALNNGLNGIKSCRENDPKALTNSLKQLAENIDQLGSVLMRMEEMCDPHIFYFRIRPYLAGWKNMSQAGLANGVFYGDEVEPRLLAGGSNAQSSLLQAFDLILNVEHNATGESSSSSSGTSGKDNKMNPFLTDMRSYMPGKHAAFLEHLSKVNGIRQYVLQHGAANPELTLAYDACLAMLKSFRDKHIQIVTRYIILQAQKANKTGSQSTKTLRSGLAKTSKKAEQSTGTGGTALLPFLKQCRDETGEPAAGSWGKRILSDNGVLKTTTVQQQEQAKKRKLDNHEEEEEEEGIEYEDKKLGMAGSWDDDMSNKKKGHW